MTGKKSIKFVLSFLIFIAFSLTLLGMEENTAFTLGDIKVSPGGIASGYLTVQAKNDPGCEIPVTVINGKKKGNVLTLAAGVHGYEYPPILALYRLKEMIDPSQLAGT